MGSDPDDLQRALKPLVRSHVPGALDASRPKQLSGGASQETWAFEARTADGSVGLVLRRAPGGVPLVNGNGSVGLETEAKLIAAVGRIGVPVATVRHVLTEEDGLGAGFLMDRVEGETIARRILRDDAFAEVRPRLARQCGEILARLHTTPTAGIDALAHQDAAEQIARFRDLYDAYDHPHPVFELAFRWLSERRPEAATPRLVHGDFRNGNLMIGPDGVRAVLDWELAHVGDPMEDLGWLCVNSWRFGEIDRPVGGFGSREELFAGYESAGGGPVDPERVRFWETLGTLKWGVMCMTMVAIFRSGADRSVERAAIGRRSSETELDLLDLIHPPG